MFSLQSTSLLVVLVICLFPSCKENTSPQEIEKTNPSLTDYYANHDAGIQNGNVKLISVPTSKGDFKVWTKRIGNNPTMKILLLNGGPGATHEYFECFENFLPAQEIEFIYYDQLGTGNSVCPQDTSFWDLARYVEEVEIVRTALKLTKDNFYLLGHSWGGILALEYALKYQQHIKGLIISNMMSSAPDYGKYADDVLAKLMDPNILDTIRDIEAKKDFTNPKYMELLMPHFYAKHICRIPLVDWPEPITRSFSKINQSLYVTMQGPSEFGISGKLEKWDRKADLSKLSVPTLIIGAKHDTMDPEHMKWMSTQVENGSYLYCPNGSHMCFYDDQQIFFNGLINFVNGVDAGEKQIQL